MAARHEVPGDTGFQPVSDHEDRLHVAPFSSVLSHSVRRMLIRSSILRSTARRLKLRLCCMLSPVKKVRTNCASDSGFIFGRSASIFLANSCFRLLRLRVTRSIASRGNMADSRLQLTAKHPFCPTRLLGPILRNRSILFQPNGSAVSNPFFSRPSR
jgi:hypothetical protein